MLFTESKKILIVEDDTVISTLYRIKFEKEWYVVKVCNNGLDAVTDVMEFSPDVILLDIMMPSMDGFETLRVIRELAPSLKTKIVMFSNLNSKTDIDRCMQNGADAYLLKANTTPSDAVKKIEELFLQEQTHISDIKQDEGRKTLNCHCPQCGEDFDQEIPN